MKLSLEEVEHCFEVLIQMLRDRNVTDVDTGNRDLYWCVMSGDWLDLTAEARVSVGSLDDDFSELKKLTGRDPFPTRVDLERLTAVLRLFAEDFFSSKRDVDQDG